MNDILQIYQSAQRSTASGRGPSFWETPMVCGKKLALMEKYKDDIASAPKSDALLTGTYFHYLCEKWINKEIDSETVIDTSEIQDSCWAEAVRLFDFYTTIRTRNFWGHVIGTEVRMPHNDAHKEAIQEHFGIGDPDTPTGAIDLLVFVTAEHATSLENKLGITLRGEGLYIVDYKTSGARASEDSAKALYTQTVQSMTYPVLWNLMHGEQIKGMIFDILVKHKTLGENSSQVFVSYPCPSHAEIVRAAVRVALASKRRARANPYACYYKGFECQFLRNATCSRI